MQILISITILLFTLLTASAQTNLILNPSFESYTTCPNSQGQIQYCSDWTSYRGSPDYFNGCSSNFSVPKNWLGGSYQPAASGNSYAGIYTYELNTPSNLREVLGGALSSPLIIGQTYSVSFKVNLVLDTGKIFNRATNNMGIRFSTVSFSSSPAPIDNFAHIYNPNVITDTLNWTTISGTVTADSAYQYVNIGNFFDDTNTSVVYMQDTLYDQAAYYFIDDVYIANISTGVEEFSNEDLSFIVYPLPFSESVNILISENSLSTEASVQLFNFSGEKMVDSTFNLKENKIVLERNDLISGIYFLKIKSGKKVYTKKVIIN